MSDIQNNRLYVLFQQWLEENNIAPDENGFRKVTTQQLWSFLNAHVLNDASTVAVDGAQVSLLWSYEIGSVSTQLLSEDLEARSNGSIRFIGNTLAGRFLAWLDSDDGEKYLAFERQDKIDPTPANNYPVFTAEVLTQERTFNQYWHKLSQFYVEQTDGTLVTLTPKGSVITIFTVDEIPAIIANDDIETINGVARKEIGIEIFSSGSKAQLYYLLAVLNGEFAGDLLRSGTARVVRKGSDGQPTFHLDLDAQTLAYLGMQGVNLSSLGEITSTTADKDAVRSDLLPAHVRGLHVALFGPVMREDEETFIDFIGRDGRDGRDGRAGALPDEANFAGPEAEFQTLQTAVETFVNAIWKIAPQADISTLLSIARIKQLRTTTDAETGQQVTDEATEIDAMADYFEVLLKHVKPYIDAAPEELKRDLGSATEQLQRTLAGTVAGVPVEAQRRHAVTTGGRALYLLDEWRSEVLDPSTNPFGPLLQGVGIYSKSETDLGTAVYVTLGASSAYAVIRRSIEANDNDAKSIAA